MKLQQGQCLIRLLDKQNSLLQQLIATTTSRTSSPAHVDRLPGCNMTTAQWVSVTKGSTTQHDKPCGHAHCFLSLVFTLLKRTLLVQNQFREKITAATQKVMWQKGFYPGDTEYDMIAMSVLSKPNLAAAKADYQLYVDLIKKVSKAHRGC